MTPIDGLNIVAMNDHVHRIDLIYKRECNAFASKKALGRQFIIYDKNIIGCINVDVLLMTPNLISLFNLDHSPDMSPSFEKALIEYFSVKFIRHLDFVIPFEEFYRNNINDLIQIL